MDLWSSVANSFSIAWSSNKTATFLNFGASFFGFFAMVLLLLYEMCWLLLHWMFVRCKSHVVDNVFVYLVVVLQQPTHNLDVLVQFGRHFEGRHLVPTFQ